MDNKMKMFYVAVGVLASVSLFVFPSTNMIAYSQGGNQTTQGVKDQAQDKLFKLTEKFNQIVKDSGLNLTLPRDGLAAKLKVLADNDAFKSLSGKFKAAVEELRGNATINIGDLKQGANLTGLVQKIQELRNQ
ncbi:MAG: hypothetical protein WAL79_01275 [Nitrososphaeraceae archaeon]